MPTLLRHGMKILLYYYMYIYLHFDESELVGKFLTYFGYMEDINLWAFNKKRNPIWVTLDMVQSLCLLIISVPICCSYVAME